MALPEASIICRYHHWRVFGTGTFTGRVPGEVAQRKLVWAFLYQASDLVGVPFGKLTWVTRRENGELSQREHYHWLLGHESWTPTLGECFTLNALWDKLPRCGFSRNHIFDPALNGVEYVTKCLSSEAIGASSGGDFYEGSKFGLRGAGVTLSNSLSRVVAGRRVCVLRHCA